MISLVTSHASGPCEQHKQLLADRKILSDKINKKNAECEDLIFGPIQKYFKKEEDKTTCKDLLEALQKLYIEGKTNDPNYSLYFHTFINMFARDTMEKLKFKRQHVFEAICKLMLLFDYDNFELGLNKKFYRSIEDFIKSPNNSKMNTDEILGSKLNESSAAGVVDIFFESEFKPSEEKCKDDWICDCETISPTKKAETASSKEKRQFVLIQNKYYENEKSINKSYDVTQIYAKAENFDKIVEGAVDKKIVLMVNNKEALDQKITRSKDKSINNLVYKTYGVKQLEDWFRRLLNDLFETVEIDIFIKKREKASNIKPSLIPKFHQQVFTQSTLRYNMEEKYKLFIWGAVPRSGKSYMIADFISKSYYRPVSERNNSIVLILGAKTETECQFIEMFCGMSDFDDYGIVSASSGILKSCPVKNCSINKASEKEKYIYIFSQEWFKQGKIKTINDTTGPINKKMTVEEMRRVLVNLEETTSDTKGKEYSKKMLLQKYTSKPNKSVKDKSSTFDMDGKGEIKQDILKKICASKKIDLFFDEIHKGGSTNNSENILYAFINAGVKIDIFVMVTATFAKPNLRYNSFEDIDTHNKGLKIIEWGYEDQQNMKQVTNNTNKDIIINSREGIERKVFENVFQKYKDEYSADSYLKIISEEYEKHPQLVLIQPDQYKTGEYEALPDVKVIFEKILNCNACKTKQRLRDLCDPYTFLVASKADEVKKMLRFIGNRKSDEIGLPHLDTKCIYAQLAKMGAPIHKPHSELWFLPDKELYDNDVLCRSTICSKIKVKKDENHDEDDDDKTGLPNIEPLTRGLAFLLMEDRYFKEKYNVLIVHNTKIEYQDMNGGIITIDKIFPELNNNIYHAIGAPSLSRKIKEVESKTFKENKSLIILTGAKLRLGISLPCVDIAFNFDNINSIDNNYQTMFRVLTERTYQSKPYGYYLDFNKERAIKFLYDYNNTYGTGKKKSDFKTKTEYLHSLLVMFNYNGLGLIKQDTIKQLKLYNELITELKLDPVSYQTFNLSQSNIENMIKKAFLNIDLKLLNELKKIINLSYTKSSKSKVNITLTEGERKKPTVEEVEEEGAEEEEREVGEEGEEEEEIDDNALLINTIAEILPSIIALLALFSNKENYNCETLEECIDNCVTNLDAMNELCNCADISKSSILACYMKYQSEIPYTKIQLRRLLIKIRELIDSDGAEQLKINLNIIFSNIKDSMGKNDNPLIFEMKTKDIQEKIEQYLPVRAYEKDKLGEVFTPESLIKEMLDNLPPALWRDPTKKWLDPANGIGNFPMVIYKRLMGQDETYKGQGLPNEYNKNGIHYKGEKEKSEHILTKMLYMCEINPKNIKISKKIFGPTANICCCDFLVEEAKWRKQFKMEKETDKFDIIIGNPPFQPEKTEHDKRSGSHGVKILWNKFIEKSLELIVQGGFLGFITPPPWRKPESELYNLMTKDNQLLYLHIFGEKKGQELFHVSQRVDLYIIEKRRKYQNTYIVDENGDIIELDLSKWAFLPNYAYKNIKKIMTSEEEGIKVIYDTTYHTQKPHIKVKATDKYKYPIVHSINQDGFVFWYTDDKSKGHFGVSKVLLNFNRHQYPVNDYEGKYGMSQITFGIPITSKKQGDCIVEAINTDEFKEIVKATKWGAFQTDWRMFKYFKPDFYKTFLGEKSNCSAIKENKSAIKIQSTVRGKLQRNKTKKIKEEIKEKEKKSQGTKKGGFKQSKKRTRKNKKSIWKIW